MTAIRVPGRSKRNLVFVRAGPLSLHAHWLGDLPEQRNWDLQISTWLPKLAGNIDGGDYPVHFDEKVKFSSIHSYFLENQQMLNNYDYIMLADDDLLFDAGSISRLFDICHVENLTLAQPALRPDSHHSYPIVLQSPRFKLRFSNYVEPMAPIFRSDYLGDILDLFSRWPTGWGYDEFWATAMQQPRYAAAIIDAEPVYHLRQPGTGEIYSTFARQGMNPQRDVEEIRRFVENTDARKLIYGGVTQNGRRLGRKRSLMLYGLHLLRIASATRRPSATWRAGLVAMARIITTSGYLPKSSAPPSKVISDAARAATPEPDSVDQSGFRKEQACVF